MTLGSPGFSISAMSGDGPYSLLCWGQSQLPRQEPYRDSLSLGPIPWEVMIGARNITHWTVFDGGYAYIQQDSTLQLTNAL